MWRNWTWQKTWVVDPILSYQLFSVSQNLKNDDLSVDDPFPWNNVGVAFKTQKKCLASWEIHLKKKTCGSCNCNLALQPFAAPVCSQEDHVPPGHLLYELSDAMWWRCPSRASELRSCGQHDSDPLPKTGNSYMIHNSNQQYYRNCFIYIIITATNRFRERER